MNFPLDSRRLKWAAASTTFLLAGVMGCSSMQLDNSSYRPGRFEFDWPSQAVPTLRARRSADERLSVNAASLVVKLQDAAVTSAVSRANSRPPTSAASVMKIDDQWSKAGILDPAVSSRVSAECSESLKLLNSDFEKVLVTDSRGHIVCQTHRTERYFQGDQPWWRECPSRRTWRGKRQSACWGW